MSVYAGPDYRKFKTASELLTEYPQLSGKDGYYFLRPGGKNNPGELVYCDMTIDGGGWMMIARSHPSTVNYNGQNWGWRGGRIGSVKDFSQAYQAGWEIWHQAGATFTEFIFGNRLNINTNEWGPFIYKRFNINYTTFLTSDTQQSASSSTLQSDINVYGTTGFPGMQSAIGYPVTGTNNNIYYMRDCCGFSSAYGGRPTLMGTTYCNNSTRYSSGPWCNGSSVDGNENFVQGGSLYGTRIHGGTNQYMIMVK
jgi:hypothetical protein